VRHPKVCHTPYFISGWGFYECERSWAFDGYEGKGCEAYVFADCDEVALFVNGEEIARQSKTENGVYKFDITYTPGEISAVAYVGGKPIGQDKISTEGKAEKIALIKERSYTKGELVYIDAQVQDKNGSLCTQADPRVTFTVDGGILMGAMGGNLICEDIYTSNVCKAEKGRALLAIKKTDKKATVRASAQGFEEALIEV
jgi:beta-galactosidase